MLSYSYVARDERGRALKGELNADSQREVRAKLHGMGLYATSITRKRVLNLVERPKKVKGSDVTFFCEQLAAMINAGLSISKSLDALEKQTENETLKQAIKDVKSDVEGGMSLANSLAKHRDIFSDLFVYMVRAGETGGVLDDMLLRLATYLDKEGELRRKIKSAFAYPVVVSVLLSVVVTFLLAFIIPRFVGVYEK